MLKPYVRRHFVLEDEICFILLVSFVVGNVTAMFLVVVGRYAGMLLVFSSFVGISQCLETYPGTNDWKTGRVPNKGTSEANVLRLFSPQTPRTSETLCFFCFMAPL